jgi:predicted O-linked N-acetylglucosamine transferase (SPINDLY family)
MANPERQEQQLLAYNLLGVSLMQQARHEEALAALGSALELDPRSAGTHLNLGSALTHLGRHAQAIAHFRKAVELDPGLVPAHSSLAHALRELGRADEALASFRAALALNPDFAPALNDLGVALDELDRHEDALQCFERALARDPRNIDAHTNMGIAYQRMGRIDDAIASHRKALAIEPRFAAAHFNLGLALRERGLPDAAEKSFRSAIAHEPGNAEAHAQLGMVHRARGRLDDAIACLERALAIRPDHVQALNHVGAAYQERGSLEEAAARFERVIALDPRSADARHNLGVALQGLSRHDEAVACFRETLKIDPQHKYTPGALLWSELLGCRWDTREAEAAAVSAAIRKGLSVIEPFALTAVSEDLLEHRLCAERYFSDRVGSRERVWKGEPYRHDRIRVAYLSADFRAHAVAYCIAELIELHDRSKFEIIGASLGAEDGSAIRSRLLRGFDGVLDLRRAGDLEAAKLLREAEVDIVVDLMGYTREGRPRILAHRPAPVQAGYLGFPGTVGADFLDYILADRFVLPESHQSFFSEKVAYLPDCYQSNDRRRDVAGGARTRGEVGLPEAGFVFCCFNNSYKIAPRMFDVWMRLLARVPQSVLWVFEDNATAGANLRKEARSRGVDPTRLVFAARVPAPEYRARCKLADLCLDTLPYNGHGTTGDMLWSGVPVLTCEGAAFPGRVAGSLLRAVGLPELVARDLAEYESTAAKLAADRPFLAELRQRLQSSRGSAPLFDTDRFRWHIESAFTTMWECAQRGEAARSFAVEPLS